MSKILTDIELSDESVLCNDGRSEDHHHIFVSCPKHDPWRASAIDSLQAEIVKEEEIDQMARAALVQWANGLCSDGPLWPANKTEYFVGFLLDLEAMLPGFTTTRTGRRILNRAYKIMRDLSGRIYGARMRVVMDMVRATPVP